MDLLTSWTLYFLAAMGFLFFLPPLAVIFYKLSYRFRCKKALGRCTRIERNRDPDSDSVMINPIIEFVDYKGEILELKTGSGYGLKYMPRLNSTVKIYYRPDTHPPEGQVASRGLWEVSIFLMLTGLVLMLPLLLKLFLT